MSIVLPEMEFDDLAIACEAATARPSLMPSDARSECDRRLLAAAAFFAQLATVEREARRLLSSLKVPS